MSDERTWRCCKCCNGIAKEDHVQFGGSVEKDGHDGPCDVCRQGSNYAANTTTTRGAETNESEG